MLVPVDINAHSSKSDLIRIADLYSYGDLRKQNFCWYMYAYNIVLVWCWSQIMGKQTLCRLRQFKSETTHVPWGNLHGSGLVDYANSWACPLANVTWGGNYLILCLRAGHRASIWELGHKYLLYVGRSLQSLPYYRHSPEKGMPAVLGLNLGESFKKEVLKTTSWSY